MENVLGQKTFCFDIYESFLHHEEAWFYSIDTVDV